jgi:hypothetical protein
LTDQRISQIDQEWHLHMTMPHGAVGEDGLPRFGQSNSIQSNWVSSV